MKNLTKIFVAVAVSMFAFACVQDTTEDLGVKVEGQGVKELTLSLEESRTHLGDKVVNEDGTSLYPLYWSEGDAISVNGVVSLPLAGVATDATSATFQFYKEVSRPLCVVYPASAAVVAEEGEAVEPEAPAPIVAYPVNFLAEQPYTVGSFAPQAAPMYGYAAALAEGEEDTPVQLNHLTGVIRLALKGNGEKVTSIKVKAEKGAIAGPFTVDCTNGTLTAQEGASNIVIVTFAEPLVLGAEAQAVYATVPAGSHGTFVITVNTEAHQKMTVKFSSDVKPINAGAVREFAEFVYVTNANDEEGVFEIDGKDALIEFARIASTFYPRTKAVVTAPIDMTGYNWKPIEGFGAFEFDGGEFAIKGLNAPLFGTTAATIKNVKLTNVNIVETADVKVGAIARVLHGSMTNCEASGTLTVNNTTFTTTSSMSSYTVISIGGMVGQASGAAFKDCTNHINVTINSLAAPEQTKVYAAVGGVAGGAHSKSSFDNVDNYGKVIADNTVSANYNMGGILGQMTNFKIELPEVTSMTNCDNYGEVCTSENNVCATLTIGGIVPNMVKDMTDFSNNTNNAPIHNSGKAGNTNMAGIVGWVNYSTIKDCTNNAPIYNEGYVTSLQIGGINGDNVAAGIVNCTNNATGALYNTAETAGGNVYIGGISGGDNADHATSNNADPVKDAVSGCYNHAPISHNGIAKSVFLSGIHARTIGVNIDNCHNTGDITHTGTTLVWNDDGKEVSHSNTYVCGINGIDSKDITNCTNTGNLTVGGEGLLKASGFYVAGIGATPKGSLKDCTNSGNISVNNVTGSGNLNIFGICATNAVGENLSIDNCDNSGSITVGDKATVTAGTTSSHSPYVGGCVGSAYNPISNCDNTGNIAVGKIVTKGTTNISGVVYKTYSTPISSCTNSGSITIGNASENTSITSLIIGGVANNVYGYMHSCENKASGDITITNVAMGQMWIAGVASGAYLTSIDAAANKWSSNNNYGDITITDSSSNASSQYIGGVAAYVANDTATAANVTEWYQCNNHGNITVTGHAQAVNSSNKNGRLHIGGCFGNAVHNFNYTECNNDGAVKAVDIKSGHNIFIAGVFGCIANSTTNKNVTFKDCVNRGAVSASAVKDASIASQSGQNEGLFVAGIIGGYWFKKNSAEHDVNYVGLKNYGALSISGSYFVSGKRESMGGIVADIAGIGDFYDCHNEGSITFEPTAGTSVVANVRIGGIVGDAYAAGSDNSPTFTFDYCTNKGNITAKSFTTNTYVMLGGITGYTYNSGTPNFTYSNCGNQGTILMENVKSTGNKLLAGGLIGYSDATKCTFTGKSVNLGTVKMSGCKSEKADQGEYVGGIVGLTTKKPVSNAESYGTVHAIGVTYAGIITGTPYAAATKASNCGVGGKLVLSQSEDVDAGGDKVNVDVETVIGSSNWYSHIYSNAVTEAQATNDGCYLLTAIPSLPQTPAAQ